ncbi:MlaD family protein [Nocardia wallacei]|uniref:MlaD family protein n=1 Tax=Nocardia wallacei TaxID=480035 RepID=UPI0024541125|nr:MlaD family protein [Nocardia wallacei]
MPVYVDHSGRSAGPFALRLLGLLVAVAVAAVAVVLTGYGRGEFADTFTLRIDTATVGEGIVPGAEVKLHGYSIGAVRGVETLGEGHQLLRLELDRHESAQLTDRVAARYSSSNLFGSTVIELVNLGGGKPLRDNVTLHIPADSPTATVTEILRRAGQLTRVLDTETARHLFDLLTSVGGAAGGTLRALFDIAAILADDRQGPPGRYLATGAELGEGAAALTPPAVDLIARMLESSAYFGEQANRDRTNRATTDAREKMLAPLAAILTEHNGELATVIDTAMDLAVPIAISAGSVAPAYQRVPRLLDRIGEAFPVVGDRVQLQLRLRVIADRMPYLLNSTVPQGGSR